MTTFTLLAMVCCTCVVSSLGTNYMNNRQSQEPRAPKTRKSTGTFNTQYLPRPTYEHESFPKNKATQTRYGQGSFRTGQNGGTARGFSQRQGNTGPFGGQDSGRTNPPDAVAFSGNRKTTQYFFQPGPVIFDDVTTNIGGAYNSDYGVFTAFEAGIYQVSYNVVSPREGQKTAAVDLLRNREVINSASGRGPSGETSNSAVVFLERFDQLSVQGRAESAVYCGEGGDDAFCSFNVALLKLGNFVDNEKARDVPGW